jgi:hypothetical protein
MRIVPVPQKWEWFLFVPAPKLYFLILKTEQSVPYLQHHGARAMNEEANNRQHEQPRTGRQGGGGATRSQSFFRISSSLHQANYINALAVSISPFFEPAKPITLGECFVT